MICVVFLRYKEILPGQRYLGIYTRIPHPVNPSPFSFLPLLMS